SWRSLVFHTSKESSANSTYDREIYCSMVVGSSVSFYFAVAVGCYSFFWIGSDFYNQFFLKAILVLVSF
ncbi:MAG: hypothetical protein ACJZ8A_05030, partial [Paracoccaceae bacterium]